MTAIIIERTVITLDAPVSDHHGNIVWALLKGMRVGIDADNGCLKSWNPVNDFLILSMSSSKDFESVWIDMENQANHKQVTLQIKI